MREPLTPGELEQMLPAEPGLRAHCRRVAALGQHVAAALRLPSTAIPALVQTALLHHESVLSPGAKLDRLLSDIEAMPESPACDDLPAKSATPAEAMADGIVEACNLFDEQMEWLPWEPKPVEDIVRGLEDLASGGMLHGEAVAGLRSLSTSFRAHKKPFPELLPPAAKAAQRTLQALGGRREFDIGEIEKHASADPMMAASLIRSANSPLHAPVSPVTTLRAAITYLGTTASSRILLATALRPLLRVSATEDIWRHSVQTSLWCERLATALSTCDPQEALLAGLLHDVGRVALCFLPGEARAIHMGLVRAGCPPAYADMVVTGFDHGQVGGEILRAWNFPPALAEVVRWHHQPERSESGLTSLLYLSEFWDCGEEDLPSEFRLRSSLERVGLTMQQLTSLGAEKNEADALSILLAA